MPSLLRTPSPPPAPARFNMAAHVLSAGQRTPDKSALEILHPGRTEIWTYAQITAAVTGTATGLLNHGAQPGDRILLRLANTVEFPITYLACLLAGLVPVPTSAALTTPEITKMAAQISPTLTVAAPGVALPENTRALTTNDLATFHDLPATRPHLADPERPGYIIFTSGSGGTPKPVTHAHRAILARQMMWEGWYGLTPSDRLLHAGAFNWTYTLGTGLMDPWAIGATALIAAPGTPASDLPALLARSNATILAAAPGVYRQMLRSDLPPLPDLRHGLSAGEALPDTTRAAWTSATQTPIHEALGMSECSTFISGSPARPAPKGTAGFPQTGRTVAVLQDGTPTPLGTPGTLAVHKSDPGLMLGYWQNGAPHLPLNGDWFETGDRVKMARGGAITYVGRVDDMMNAGGFRVSPLEVEAAMATCAGIGEIAVTEVRPAPDKSLIAAFTTGPADPEALRAHAAASLARYKQPHIWEHRETLPRNPNGKVNRKALREEWCAEAHPT